MSARTCNAIAMAITQSSCTPAAAPVRPSLCLTKVRHSANNLELEKICGPLVSAAPKSAIIAGRVIAVVSQPACPRSS